MRSFFITLAAFYTHRRRASRAIIKKDHICLIDKCGLFSGAGDEARTRYLHLGKVALYRMSYTRVQESL